MVETQCLTEAAVSLSNIFSQANIYHVFFGGWVSVLEGCQRETKDVDCFVATTKERALILLHNSNAMLIPQMRTDYLGLFWPTSWNKSAHIELFFGISDNLKVTEAYIRPKH